MSVVYHHLLTAKDMLVCVLLLQLVELRASNWQPDAAVVQFYNSRRRILIEQQVTA